MKSKYFLYLAWIQSLFALFGSLYFSEILHYPPCTLCWYQRICLYPLALLLPIGLLYKDRNIYRYVLPLAIVGFLISCYQNLLYYRVLPENLAPCSFGVSCTTKYVEYFGFISIPLLALLATTVIIISLIAYKKYAGRS
jgi:disulfide bond formation protein DsbB